jgi:hypothetical protein
MSKINPYLVFVLACVFCGSARAALKIGWAESDITPPEAVSLAGSFGARVSERVCDPITATVLVLESGGDHVVWITCDLVAIADELRDAVRARVAALPGLDPKKVILNATHSHSAPELRPANSFKGVKLPVMQVEDLQAFIAGRIVQAVEQAWRGREAGGFSYGLSHAVIGRNRRTVDREGRSTMYGDITKPEFSHIEGYEDHTLNVLTTYNLAGELTGVLLNFACPVQAEYLREVSADFLHETRGELRRRVGRKLFVAAQISAAGDIAPHLERPSTYDQKPLRRMFALRQAESGQALPPSKAVRHEIARRLVNATEEILPLLAKNIDRNPRLKHQHAVLNLPMSRLTERDAAEARKEAAFWEARYEAEKKKLEALPEPPKQGPWYLAVTHAYGSMRRHQRVLDRYARQQASPTHPTQIAEVHCVRLGDMAFASNPFEYYVDYGIQIKARSPATQTFLVQLAGAGTYVPSLRSTKGGGYGSEPASNPVGPEGGAVLCERTLELLRSLW